MEQGEWYTPAELHELPTLCVGQADSQVGETEWKGRGAQRVWYDRTGEGWPVSVETLDDNYRWTTTYEGDPARIRINYADTVEIDE